MERQKTSVATPLSQIEKVQRLQDRNQNLEYSLREAQQNIDPQFSEIDKLRNSKARNLVLSVAPLFLAQLSKQPQAGATDPQISDAEVIMADA